MHSKPKNITITINTISGPLLVYDLNEKSTIYELKEKICSQGNRFKVKISEQTVVLDGKKLKNKDTLPDCFIDNTKNPFDEKLYLYINGHSLFNSVVAFTENGILGGLLGSVSLLEYIPDTINCLSDASCTLFNSQKAQNIYSKLNNNNEDKEELLSADSCNVPQENGFNYLSTT